MIPDQNTPDSFDALTEDELYLLRSWWNVHWNPHVSIRNPTMSFNGLARTISCIIPMIIKGFIEPVSSREDEDSIAFRLTPKGISVHILLYSNQGTRP